MDQSLQFGRTKSRESGVNGNRHDPYVFPVQKIPAGDFSTLKENFLEGSIPPGILNEVFGAPLMLLRHVVFLLHGSILLCIFEKNKKNEE